MTDTQAAYREYLKSDHWRALRIQAFRVYGRKCYKCPKRFGLDVHHLRYRHPWTACTVEDVRPCCRNCHELEHGIVRVVAVRVKRVWQKKQPRRPKKQKHLKKKNLRVLRRQWIKRELNRDAALSNLHWKRRNWSL